MERTKQRKYKTEIAQLLYSVFTLDEIYLAAADGMAHDVNCKSKTGIPVEITEEEFDEIAERTPAIEKARAQSFQKQANAINKKTRQKYGSEYDEYKGLTETEYYAYLYISGIWYRE